MRVALILALVAIGCSKDTGSKPAGKAAPPAPAVEASPPLPEERLPPPPVAPTAAELDLMKNPPYACQTSADCAMVTRDCCPCSANGAQIAIRADQAAAYEAASKKRCADTMCSQAVSKHPSCFASAVCEGGTCTVGKATRESDGGE